MQLEDLQEKVSQELEAGVPRKWGFDVIWLTWNDFAILFTLLFRPFLIGIGFWRWIVSFGKQVDFSDTSTSDTSDNFN